MPGIRAALHVHSDWSYDGQWPLDRIAAFFERRGAQAVMMTEHDRGFTQERFDAYRAACNEASRPGCRLVPGIEYSDADNRVHVLTWGMDRFLGENRPTLDLLRDVRDAGGVAILAHPVRREAWRAVTPEWLPLLSGIELWNRKADGVTWGREAARLIADSGLMATVGPDFHHRRHAYPLLNETQVEAAADLEAALVAAIRAGRLTPLAFGRPLIGADGQPARQPHDALEWGRRALRRLVRGAPRSKTPPRD